MGLCIFNLCPQLTCDESTCPSFQFIYNKSTVVKEKGYMIEKNYMNRMFCQLLANENHMLLFI